MLHPLAHKYQGDAYRFAIQYMAVYMMIDAGLGKTLISLMFLRKLNRPAIVVAPLRVCYSVWPNEIKKWFPDMSYVILHGPKKDKLLKIKADVYIINYEGLPWFYKACCNKKFPLKKYPIVFDEATFVKEASTKRFKIIKKMMPLLSKYRLALSATPAPIGLHNLWSQYYMLDNGSTLGKFYSHFRDLYFVFSGPPYYRTTLRSQQDKQEIFRRIKPRTFRLAAKDYLELPPLHHIVHKLELTGKLKKQYTELAANAMLDLKHDVSVAALSDMSLKVKLRQFMQGALYYEGGNKYTVVHKLKVEFLKRMVDELQGEPLLVPINFRFELEMIQKELGKLPYIAGGVSAKKSNIIAEAWNEGKIPILLCHPKSVSHGLNLQGYGHNILWLALPWSIETFQQLYSRLWRQGQTKPVMNHMCIIKDTVDDEVLPVLKKRGATQNDLFKAVMRGLKVR